VTSAAPEYSNGVKCAWRKQRDSAMEMGIAAVTAVFIQRPYVSASDKGGGGHSRHMQRF
jgi:hypothetical protein